jgi:hypothetical protein
MALENMAASFSGLPMGDLIGGPLNASCDAQIRLAMATANFIKIVGFNVPTDDKNVFSGGVRTALFKFRRPVLVSPAKPEVVGVPAVAEVKDASGNVITPAAPEVKAAKAEAAVIKMEEVELEVPVLAIVKIPSLSITTVDITFDMEVKSAESSKDSRDTQGSLEASASVGWGPFKASVTVKGSVATHKENTRSSDNSAKYHVEVHAVDGGMPEGLARVLDIMAQAVAPKSISAAA